MSCSDKNNPQIPSSLFRPFELTYRFPPQVASVDEETCQQSCDKSVCCNGPNCQAGCRCLPPEGSPVGENTIIISGTTCDPNPCCPGCDPYFNQLTQSFTGKCCRAVYIDDGTGACCPNDCCGFLPPAGTPIAADGKNGACCPDAKPHCCTPRGCQSVVPTECDFGRVTDSCLSPRQFIFDVPSGPFTADVQVYGNEFRENRSTVFQAKPESVFIDYGLGEIELAPAPITDPNFQALANRVSICKPRGVTQVSFRIASVRVNISNCGSTGIVGPECDCDGPAFSEIDGSFLGNKYAWRVQLLCLDGCACDEDTNPLP